MQAPDRISLVLRAPEGKTLEQIQQFVQLGAPVAIGRGMAIIAGASEGDVMEKAEQLENQVILAESAMRRGTLTRDQDHLPALRRVIDHVPELYLQVADAIRQQVLDDGDDEAMADEAAGQAIRVLVTVKQRLEKLLEPDLLSSPNMGNVTTDIPVVAESMHIDDRVKMVGAEPAFLTVVFKLPSLNDAKPLIDLLPYGQRALGTEAEVYGFSTGNLMEAEPCEQ